MTTKAPSDRTTESDNKEKRQAEESMLRERMAGIGEKLLVLSGKGGVGKSTVAVNLALALSNVGNRVGLLDIDIHGPSVPTMLGLQGQPVQTVDKELIPVNVTDNLAVMSIGFLLSSDVLPVIWRGPMKYHVIRQFLKDVAWGQRDFLVVDSPPGTGDEPLSIAQLVGTPARAVIVTTPQELALADVRRCVSFCRKMELPIVGIVENMSGFVCPQCHASIDLFKRDGGMALALETDVPFLGRIPIDPDVVTAGDMGVPLVREGHRSPAADAFSTIVDAIVAADAKTDADGGRGVRREDLSPLS